MVLIVHCRNDINYGYVIQEHGMDFIGWLESQERSPLTEAAVSGYRVIFEDQEGDSQKKSRQLLEKRGYDPEKQKEIINSVRDSIPALKNRVRGGKFTLACVRMFVDGEIRDEDTINKLNQIVRKIGETEYEKYDKDLNGFHAEELISKYMPAIEKEKDEQVSRLSSVHFSGNSDYEVVLIPDFNASSEYHKYNEWCLTYKPEMFDTYTQKGMNSLYFLLKKGFDYTSNFFAGFAVVKLNGKYNFIDTEGKLLSEKWFDKACDFFAGFAEVMLNGKYMYIDTNGKLTYHKHHR